MMVRGQVIIQGECGQVTDINHLAIWAAIDNYKVIARTEVFEKVQKIFHHFLKLSWNK